MTVAGAAPEPRAAGEAVAERALGRGGATVASAVALAFAAFEIWLAAPWSPPLADLTLRSIHLAFAFALCFLLVPAAAGRSPSSRPSVLDLALAAGAIAAFAYIIVSYDWIMENPASSTPAAVAFGTIAIVATIEACRRTIGWIFVALVLAALAYAWAGALVPGQWGHIGFAWPSIIESLYLSSFGLLGHITGVSANVIAPFLIFGALLARTGGGETFIDLAKLIAGRSAGGPAKVAVFSSAFFGTISGSAVANVVVSGVFSIPLMKRMGYRPAFAAAVEATASTGGQLVPPIMGAGAFIMAELLGIPYWDIAVAAILPAWLYYLGCTACVHLEALRRDLPRLEPSMIPRAAAVLAWRRSLPLFGPILALLVFLARGYTPASATFWAIVVACLLHLAFARGRRDALDRLREIVAGFAAGGRAIMLVATLVAAAGIIIGAINLTGVGIKLSDAILGLGGGAMIASLMLAMVICIVLGMGLPTTAAYVLAAAVVAPAIVGLGIPPLAAHLFVFYFAIISAITPPICPAVYVSAALAETGWVRTSGFAMQLGLAGFIVPYMFIFSPELLLAGETGAILLAAATASIGVLCLAVGLIGQLDRRLNPVSRALFLATAILLIKPGLETDAIGAALLALALALHWLLGRSARSGDRGAPTVDGRVAAGPQRQPPQGRIP